MNIETDIAKNPRSGWEGKSYIIIAEGIDDGMGRIGTLKLCIHTSKANGGLQTRASVSIHFGTSYTHAFGLGSGLGDYSEKVIVTPTRCTEKAVREQHAQALTHAPAYFERAQAHYAAQEARKAREAMPA